MAETIKPLPSLNNHILGIPVFSTMTAVEQFRFPRTKKRRIRKKWAARRENFRPDPNIYHIAGAGYVGHPATIAKMKGQLENG